MQFDLSIKRDDWRYLAIILQLTYTSYSVFLYSLFGMTSLMRYVAIIPTLVVYFMAFTSVRRSEVRKISFCIILAGFLYVVQYILYPSNHKYLNEIFSEWIVYLPFCVLLVGCELRKFIKAFENVAYILFICNFLEPILKFTINQDRGYMIYGFRYIPAAVIFAYLAFLPENRGRSKRYWFFSTISLLEALILGNRSILVSFLVFLVVFIISCTGAGKKIKWVLGVVAVAISASFLSTTSFLSILSAALERFGISSRTLTMLLTSTYSDDNGRDLVWSKALTYVKEKPVFGYGIGGDRALPLASWNLEQYVHNLVLEVFLDFGVLIGGAALIWLVYMIIKRIAGGSLVYYKGVIIVLVSLAIPKLFVSSSFWLEPLFWYLIAALLWQNGYFYYGGVEADDTEESLE